MSAKTFLAMGAEELGFAGLTLTLLREGQTLAEVVRSLPFEELVAAVAGGVRQLVILGDSEPPI